MAEGTRKTIKVVSIDPNTWSPQDNPEKVYWTIQIEGYNAETISWVQDKSKGAPAPEEGKEQEGLVYPRDKGGFSFYPSRPRSAGGFRGAPRADHHEEIKAQWAIGQAVQICELKDLSNAIFMNNIETCAKELFSMVDRVKGSSESTDPKVTNLPSPQSTSTPRQQDKQPARPWDSLGKEKSQEEVDSLVSSAVGHMDDGMDEPINLDDIPF